MAESTSKRIPKVHELKTHPEYFRPITLGEKCFEIRRNDRDFAVGDTLRLCEFDPIIEEYSGYWADVRVQYILPRGLFDIPDHMSVMSIKLVK